jgi:hypothetical protein
MDEWGIDCQWSDLSRTKRREAREKRSKKEREETVRVWEEETESCMYTKFGFRRVFAAVFQWEEQSGSGETLTNPDLTTKTIVVQCSLLTMEQTTEYTTILTIGRGLFPYYFHYFGRHLGSPGTTELIRRLGLETPYRPHRQRSRSDGGEGGLRRHVLILCTEYILIQCPQYQKLYSVDVCS